MSIKVFVVDDDKDWIKGLRWFIEKKGDLVIVSSAHTRAELLSCLRANLNVDVVLLDIRLAGENGVDLIQPIRLSWPAVKIVMMTSVDEGKFVMECMQKGANDYVVKPEYDAIPPAIRFAMSHEYGLHQSAVAALKREFSAQAKIACKTLLTGSELRVLAMFHEGQSAQEIQATLGVTERTLRNYISKVNGKLGTASRDEAVMKAVELGLI